MLRAAESGGGVKHVAEHTGLHPNTVRFHLERLADDGLITRQVRRSGEPGRPPLTYLATPVPDAHRSHRDFARLAEVLAQVVARTSTDPAAAAVEAGRSWGLSRTPGRTAPTDTTAAVKELARTLDEDGFAPKISTDDHDGHTIVWQRHCPYLEVAQTHQDVVCSVHLGLMRGVLERLQAPVDVERLVSLASPVGCAAHLTSRSVRSSRA
ncbi:metalloregulator ArsR/SmtB family transcription factor [uncultured Cellulomonas sp.]|uniref:helix-turn-helix transcriptional regulator n=1 Tax=uncultured Cellulomonas sp. TaxID=189682 RepID=UPI0026324F65|nr:hypothetical protein [uncultured Cellulomonas sp.]